MSSRSQLGPQLKPDDDAGAWRDEAWARTTELLLRWMFQIVPAQKRRALRFLLDRGWWALQADMPLAAWGQLAQLIADGRRDEAEALMQHLAASLVERVARRVRAMWPGRWAILADAFRAHRDGLYTLSVPVMLMQADGICSDLLGAPLFAKEKGAPRSKKALEQKLSAIKVAGRRHRVSSSPELTLEPLRTPSSIGQSTDQRDARRRRDATYGPLNRHAVLHGLDVAYATEANSLRAVLILGYLAYVSGELEAHGEQAKQWQELFDEVAQKGPRRDSRERRVREGRK